MALSVLPNVSAAVFQRRLYTTRRPAAAVLLR
jgi:hypothetical protein